MVYVTKLYITVVAGANGRFSLWDDYVKIDGRTCSVTTNFDFLREHPISASLNAADLQALDRIAQEFEFDEGSVIAYQRDRGDSMVIVKSGRLYAEEVDREGVVRDTTAYTENSFFGADWLFETGSHPATVKATDAGSLLMINGEEFRQFLVDRPQALNQLRPLLDEEGEWFGGLPTSAWALANKMPLREGRGKIGHVRLLPDEIVVYYTRRSIIYLFQKLFWPGLTLIILSIVMAIVWSSDSPIAVKGLITVFTGIIMALAAFFTIFWILDWRNDYFVITNMHITHREFDLRSFTTLVSKVPISRVQTVSMEKPTLIDNLLGLGAVRITTASNVGTIGFSGIHNPSAVREAIERVQRQVEVADLAQTQSILRESVERRFEMEPEFRSVEFEDEAPGEEVYHTEQRRSVWQFISNPFSGRTIDGKVITYHRNIFVLLRYWRGPFLFFLFLVGATFVTTRLLGEGSLITWLIFPLFFVNLFWFWWMFEDWHNDIFQLTDQVVIDLDRSPLRTSVSRKQAPLGNIQNVRVNR